MNGDRRVVFAVIVEGQLASFELDAIVLASVLEHKEAVLNINLDDYHAYAWSPSEPATRVGAPLTIFSWPMFDEPDEELRRWRYPFPLQ